MRFCCSPVEIKGDGKVECDRDRPQRALRATSPGAIRARDTGEREEIECGLVLRSIGYKGVGLEGIPFDAGRGLIPNESGRVIDPETGEQVPGHYAVGWIKRGPSGVIGTNKKDALDTVDLDLRGPRGRASRSRAAHAGRSRGRGADRRSCWTSAAATTSPTWAGRRSTPPRVAAGEPHGRPRVKFCRVARDGRGRARRRRRLPDGRPRRARSA